MSRYIVDASLLLNALLGNNPKVKKRFLDLFENKSSHLFAPELLQIEFRNALRFSLTELKDIQELVGIFAQLPIQYLRASQLDINRALAFSWQYKTTVYDSLYHSLALAHQAIFVTCDKKYYEAAKSLGNIEFVES